MPIDDREVSRRLNELAEREIEDKQIPSISYALVAGEELWDVDHVAGSTQQRLGERTVFRVGSCSKMFTALALMRLAEQGRVELDAEVAAYIPGFRLPNPFAVAHDPQAGVTLRKLLSHTSGLVREPAVGHYLDDSRPPLAATVDSLRAAPLKEDPVAGVFRYSNAGFAVVGRVVEQVSGEEFTAHAREHLLDPLGMKDSAFALTPQAARDLAPARMWSFAGDFPAPVFDLGGAPAGNLYATLPDMAAFVQALLRGGSTDEGRRIVQPSTLQAMWEPVGAHGKLTYGLGFAVGEVDGWRAVGHGGAVYGFATQCLLLPEARVGVVVCSTLDATNVVASRIGQYALRLLLAPTGQGQVPPPPPPARPVEPAHLAALPGWYRNRATAEVAEVVAKEGKLYLMGDGLPLRIQPRSRWEFLVDGRVFGPGSDYPHLEVSFSPPRPNGRCPTLRWRAGTWERIPQPAPEAPPPQLAPHIGEYGPDFNVAHISYESGRPRCLVEYFYSHTLEEVAPATYKMHGLLYEDETLSLGARDERGRPGIRIGPMFLRRRPGKG
ncbi:MAG: serine hydrolase domain-containing protein [Candidatus Bipolaricaulaceae bacterium]